MRFRCARPKCVAFSVCTSTRRCVVAPFRGSSCHSARQLGGPVREKARFQGSRPRRGVCSSARPRCVAFSVCPSMRRCVFSVHVHVSRPRGVAFSVCMSTRRCLFSRGAERVLQLNLNLTPYTLRPTPCNLHPTPSIIHPAPYNLNPKRRRSNA